MPSTAQLLAEAQRLRDAGDWRRAAETCKKILQSDPSNARAYHLMAELAAGRAQLPAAIEFAARAATIDPTSGDFHLTLGILLLTARQADGARTSLEAAVERLPESFDAWANLGAALGTLNRTGEAAAAMDRAIGLEPGREEAHANRAQLARRCGRLTEAVDVLQRAIARGVSGARVQNNLGSTLRLLGRVDESVAAFRRSIELDPRAAVTWDNFLYALLFHSGSGADRIADAQWRWSASFANPLKSACRPHANDRSPDRRLRIGYVSGNLRSHPVGVFMEPILAGHDRARFEVHCYSDVPDDRDPLTFRLRALADVWHDTRRADDAALADLVRQDRIDVLVDLNQRMGGSRLLAFARKPAPVQVAYLGYAASTGLPTMDYRIGDPHLDPPGRETAADVERVERLPETYWCYRAPAGAPEPSDLPAKGPDCAPAFGSFNAAAKVNPQVVAVWSTLLHAVPGSRLIMMLGGIDESDPHWRHLFAQHGIAPDRLRFVGYRPYLEYLRLYGEVDVALDPFPYNGGTTTLDGLWMGVPTVTLAGRSGVSRAGVSILTNVGLSDLIAGTSEDYVRIAGQLASDLPRLRELRSTLRPRLRESPLMDEPRFVRNLEATYRTMWVRWCDERGGVK